MCVILARLEIKLENAANTLSLTGVTTNNWGSTHEIECNLHLWGDTDFVITDLKKVSYSDLCVCVLRLC